MTEALAPGTGSQLYDYLESPVCLRPAGYDPMVNLLTIEDAALALQKLRLVMLKEFSIFPEQIHCPFRLVFEAGADCPCRSHSSY